MSNSGQHSGSSPGMGPAPLAGQMLGHFQCLRPLGQGMLSAVWLAQDVSLQRTVALKLLPEQDPANPHYALWLKQCILQARSAVQVTSPDVVKIYEIGHEGGYFFIAMEALVGGSLEGILRQKGPLSIPEAVEYILQAGAALQFAHQRGVAHCNLKPSNILLTEAGRCKLSEFGLAILEDPGKTLENMKPFIGEPHFLAPEVLVGEPSIQSDLFSLAATLWYLISGKHPYPVKELKDVLRVGSELPLNDLHKHCPKAPEPLYNVLEKALNYWPEDRFNNFDEMVPYLRAATDPATLALAALSSRRTRRPTTPVSRPAAPQRPQAPSGPGPAVFSPAAPSASPAESLSPRSGGTRQVRPAAKRMPPHVLWMIIGGGAAVLIAVIGLLIIQPWESGSNTQVAKNASPWDAAGVRKTARPTLEAPVENPIVEVVIPPSSQPTQPPPATATPVTKPSPPAKPSDETKPDAGDTVTLPAKDAKLQGKTLRKTLRLQSVAGVDNIGYWTNSKEWISWTGVSLTAGTYEVKGSFASPTRQGEVSVVIDGQKIGGKIAFTGSYDKFQEVELGRIEIKTSSDYSVEVRPVEGRSWHPVNLAKLTFQKVK